MFFKGKPNESIIITKKKPASLLVATYRIIQFDEVGECWVEDEYIIKKLLANGYKEIKKANSSAEIAKNSQNKPRKTQKTTKKRKNIVKK